MSTTDTQLDAGEHALVAVLRDMERERSRSADSQRAVVRSLAAALEARDGYTGGHSDEVHALAGAVGRRLGLAPAEIDEIRTVALLHDIGKIGIPDHILHKPGRLSPEEWDLMREHPAIGERILRPLPGMGAVATAVRHEHERWDGDGYPDGLAGDAIPLASRVVLACDAWHALVSDRPYREALPRAEALAELRRCAGSQFDPRVVDALIACLEDPDDAEAAGHDAEALDRGVADSRLQREVRALLTVAGAVAAVHKLDDVIDTAAEETRRALDAGSLSISRLELEEFQLRTLINAGDLAPGEERLPADEVYPLRDYPRLMKMFERMEPHLTSIDDVEHDPAERDLLRSLGKSSGIAVPIVFADRMWGELYAARALDAPPFDAGDVRFLQAIAGQIAAAIGRAEMFTRMAELAFEDSLTGLANRRALDERLESEVTTALDGGRDLALVMCDVDNLKDINDELGHQAGDAALVRVAQALRDAVADRPDALVGRLGGDEFCLLLPDTTAADARTFIERALASLAGEGAPAPGLSGGIASVGSGARRPADLMRSADAALYTAKRNGRRRVFVARADAVPAERPARERRAELAPRLAADLHRLVGDTVAELEGIKLSALERLSVVAMRITAVAGAPACAISHADAGADTVETVWWRDMRSHEAGMDWIDTSDEVYALEHYPATAAIMASGGSFVTRAEDPDADPAEVELLGEGGVTNVVATAACWERGCWLVEVYGDGSSVDPEIVEPYLRLLVAEAVRGAVPVAGANVPAVDGVSS